MLRLVKRKTKFIKAEPRTCLSRDELDLLKLLKLTSCDMEDLFCKVTDEKSFVNDLFEGLHLGTMDVYVSICHNIGQSLVEVSYQIKEVLNSDQMNLLQDGCDIICSAAIGIRMLFIDAPDVVDKSYSLTVRRAKQGDLENLGSFSARATSREPPADDARADTDGESVLTGISP